MEKKINPLLLWRSFYAFIVTGMIVLMPGAIMPYLLQHFHLSYDQGGSLLALQAVGNLTASLLGGVFSDFVGRKATLLFGAACFVAGFGGMLLGISTWFLYIFIFVSGLGWGIMNSLVNAVVNDAAEGRSSVINLLHMFFALGAFAAPFLVSFILKLGFSWHYAVITVTAMSVLLLFLFIRMPIETPIRDKGMDGHSPGSFLRNPRFYLFMAILFLYVGTENSINGWLVTYLTDARTLRGISPQDVLSLFWVAIILGRFLISYVSGRFSRESVILVSSIGGALFFILFLMTSNQILIPLSVAIMGLAYSGIYPTTVANANPLLRGSGAATGIMLSLGGLGGAAIPYIKGLVAESRGIQAGMTVIVVSALLMSWAALANVWLGRRAGD
ncbi:MAG: MFS transporter [Clostridia bacterium]